MRIACDGCGCLMEVPDPRNLINSIEINSFNENGQIKNRYILCPECSAEVFSLIEELQREAEEEEEETVFDEPDTYKEKVEEEILERMWEDETT